MVLGYWDVFFFKIMERRNGATPLEAIPRKMRNHNTNSGQI